MENSKSNETQTKKKFSEKLDSFFGIKASGSSIRVEIIAGIATFLAMAYILVVNPNNILFAGTADVRWASVFIATAFGAVIGTLLMALLAKMPLAQAPGLGLNSAVGALVGGVAGVAFPLGTALLLVFVSGVIFMILSIVPCGKDRNTGRRISLRERIFDGIPKTIRLAIPVGIGLFIAFIGLKNASIVVDNPFTYVSLVNFTSADNWGPNGAAPNAIVCIVSLLIIAALSHYKVKGAVIIGILVGTLLGIPLGVTSIDTLCGNTGGITWKFWENFQTYFSMNPENGGVFGCIFTEGIAGLSPEMAGTCIVTIVSFCMIDMFDTMGTVVGCTSSVGLVDENGKPHNYAKIMYSDSIATVVGAIGGTSTVTTFVESSVGVGAGGRTGLTSLTTACLFFLSIFILPLFAFIPSSAAASALIYVGVLMMHSVSQIDFKNIKNALPAFVTIIMMPLCFSITDGIGCGIIMYVFIAVITWCFDSIKKLVKHEQVDKIDISSAIIVGVVFALFVVYFITK